MRGYVALGKTQGLSNAIAAQSAQSHVAQVKGLVEESTGYRHVQTCRLTGGYNATPLTKCPQWTQTSTHHVNLLWKSFADCAVLRHLKMYYQL